MDSLFNHIGSSSVQGLYKALFGPDPATTNPVTGQMVVMFHDADDHAKTGIAYSAPQDVSYTTVHFRRASWEDSNVWYRQLVVHEFAHAWHYRNLKRFSAAWSSEGIANFAADEDLRTGAGLSLDANHDLGDPLFGWRLRLMVTGDFVSGYRESHPFLRYMVQELLQRGQSYDAAVNRE